MVSNQHLFPSTPVYTNKLAKYQELHLFKTQIESEQYGPKFKPYSATKKNVSVYRMIFLCIGALYFLLGLILFYKSLSWTCSVLFGSCFYIKTLLCSFCGFSAVSSVILGFLLKTEKEAAKRLYRHSKRRIRQIYERKMIKFGVKRFFSFGEEYRKFRSFKHLYLDALEKLQECKDNTLYLLDSISRSGSLDSRMREELYNQAILELKDRSEIVIRTYNTSQPPRILETLG
ncbi:MAG: hypothetical protein ACE5GN_03480 [Waddliaceae bacterium]